MFQQETDLQSFRVTGLDQLKEKMETVTDSLGTMVAPVANFWEGSASKRKTHSPPIFGLFHDSSTKSKGKTRTDWGPGGALGIGCGAGIGVAITGGAGIGASPWNAFRLVFGIGVGCGVGLGYGYGKGIGVRWDKRPKKTSSSSKRVVIEI